MQLHIIIDLHSFLYAKTYKMNIIADFVKKRRKQAGLTQEEFALRAGVALTVIRKIEQGKENFNLEKVNQVLKMFGHTLAPVNTRVLFKNDEYGV
jgi:y4mF family transcriptional regulator